jgi:hypothetical protein
MWTVQLNNVVVFIPSPFAKTFHLMPTRLRWALGRRLAIVYAVLSIVRVVRRDDGWSVIDSQCLFAGFRTLGGIFAKRYLVACFGN